MVQQTITVRFQSSVKYDMGLQERDDIRHGAGSSGSNVGESNPESPERRCKIEK